MSNNENNLEGLVPRNARDGEMVTSTIELKKGAEPESKPKKKRHKAMPGIRIPLQEAIDHAVLEAEKWDDRDSLPVSMIGAECERALWYHYRWATEGKSFSGRLIRRFRTGDSYETRVIEWLKLAGYEVHHVNPRARNPQKQYSAAWLGGIFRGLVDGFVRGGPTTPGFEGADLGDQWHLLEVKAVVSGRYAYEDKTYETPIANRHPTEHPTSAGNPADIEGKWWKIKRQGFSVAEKQNYAQMQAYMALSKLEADDGKPNWQRWGLDGPVTRTLGIAVNTDTEQIHAEIIELEPRYEKAVMGRAVRVVRATEPPERFSENPIYPPCSFCDHRPICHGGEPMRITCRTCRHARVTLPGDKTNFSKRAQWFCDFHKSGCGDDFKACDHYKPIVESIPF